jgi:hypothetical protein
MSDIAFEVTLDDSKEAIEALAHVDGLRVEVDLDSGTEGQHLCDSLQNLSKGVEGFDG